jgi:hypothetical protein
MLSDSLTGVIIGGSISMVALLINTAAGVLQKGRERRAALRRDIYLPAIEALAAMADFLAHLVLPSPTEGDAVMPTMPDTTAIETLKAVCDLFDARYRRASQECFRS